MNDAGDYLPRRSQTAAEFMKAFKGGDLTIDNPAYQADGIVAYSPAEAQNIFENLIHAQIRGHTIPFIASDNSNGLGLCTARKNLMIQLI